MQQEIYDARLQHYLKGLIRKYATSEQLGQLKSLRLCNTKLIMQPNVEPAVFLLRNNRGEGEAKFFGQMTCKNPWACPHCSTMMMAKYKEKIALALEALRSKQNNLFGFMMTFTIPHLRFQSCKEVTDLLYLTFRNFWRNCWKRRLCKDGKTFRTHSPFNTFIVENNVQWYVRCAEYTWGKKNGWHPHFHCILWMSRDKVKDFDVEKWQKILNDDWAKCAERTIIRYWEENHLYEGQDREAKAKSLLMFVRDEKKRYERPAIAFSTTKEGKIAESSSSDYLCGWGADSELTGNFKKKASNPEHLTPYQILELAADGNEEMEKLYFEFCLQVTRKPTHHRVDTKPGLMKLVAAWKNTEEFKKLVKKKAESQSKVEWELVCWFSKEQWWRICDLDDRLPMLSNILYLAARNKKELLIEYLEFFDIYMIVRPHMFGKHVENIFNNVAA